MLELLVQVEMEVEWKWKVSRGSSKLPVAGVVLLIDADKGSEILR